MIHTITNEWSIIHIESKRHVPLNNIPGIPSMLVFNTPFSMF